MKYRLTVVTTTYNQEKYIRECIEGVICQKTNFPFQFIISDDCSTDSTRNIIEEYRKKYPDIIKPIYREKNLGPMDNFIQTLDEAHTEYVALCDGDDYWTSPNKLQIQVDYLDKHKDYSICCHKTKIFFEDNSQEPIYYPVEMKEDVEFSDFMKGNLLIANSVVYRWLFQKKDSFLKAFPKNIIPGDFYVHLLHAKVGKVHYFDIPMSAYRRQENGMWYGTSKPELKIKFYVKNGMKIINFYTEAEKNIGIDDDDFDYLKDWTMQATLDAAFRTNNKELLREFISTYYKSNKYIFNEFYITLGWYDRLKYKLRVKKIIDKL